MFWYFGALGQFWEILRISYWLESGGILHAPQLAACFSITREKPVGGSHYRYYQYGVMDVSIQTLTELFDIVLRWNTTNCKFVD